MGSSDDDTGLYSGISQKHCGNNLPFGNRLKPKCGGPLATPGPRGSEHVPLLSACPGLLWALVQHQENRPGIRPQDEPWCRSSCKEVHAIWGPFVPVSWDCGAHRILLDLQNPPLSCSYKQALAHGLHALSLHLVTQLTVTFVKLWLSRARNYFANRD